MRSPKILVLLSFLFGAELLYSAPPTTGKASFYGEELRGRKMANGQPFNPDAYTCASWFYPLGTVLAVGSGSRMIYVVVTDRGPSRRLVAKGRIIDLSHAAFFYLADPKWGLIDVTVTRIGYLKK